MRIRVVPALGLVLALFLAVAAFAHILVEKTEPADGSALTATPRTLRVWFNRGPDVANSELKLIGPEGELTLEGLHTMGENDLMVRVVGRVPDGDYVAKWKSQGDDGHSREGEWTFSLKRGG